MMKEPPNDINENDEDHKYKLADLIHYSRGEVVLLEKDFTDYTSKEIEDVKGFKNLECDFSKDGIRVSGSYVATFLFRFNIRMEVLSKLAFDERGLCLTDTTLFVVGSNSLSTDIAALERIIRSSKGRGYRFLSG